MNTRPIRLFLPLLASLVAVPLSAVAQAPAVPPSPAPVRETPLLPSLAPLIDSVKSAVVNVDVQSRVGQSRSSQGGDGQEGFDFFIGSGQDRQQLRQGLGSGFIIDPKGMVLTNNHVVKDAVAIQVRLDDGRSFEAEVVGKDPLTDVALLRLKGNPSNLPSVKLGDSDAMRVGDFSVAIGNPFGLASSVSLGIISARARDIHAGPYDDFLQTDAAINPGNSGGPLFNLKGEVIGINTAIVGSATGIGFAVPSNLARALIPQLEKEGSVTRAWLGIGIQDLTSDLARELKVPQPEGAIVLDVNDGSPAKKAGLKSEDVIVSVDGQKISSGGQLTRTVALKRPGSTSVLKLFRTGQPMELPVVLGTRPDLEKVGSPKRSEVVEETKKLRIGVVIQDMDPRLAQRFGLPSSGALIAEVVPGSPAEHAELQAGMVVVEAGRKPVQSRVDLWTILQEAKPGSSILMQVRAPGGAKFLKVLRLP